MSHLLTLHCLHPKFPEIIGLIDIVEESSSSRNCRFIRILRDLFSSDQKKREFSTSVIKNNISKDCHDKYFKDILKEYVNLQNPIMDV